MSTEIYRRQYGETLKGYVVVIGKEGAEDEHGDTSPTYEVRHGVRTVETFDNQAAAETLAAALVGEAPPVVAPVAEEPEPEFIEDEGAEPTVTGADDEELPPLQAAPKGDWVEYAVEHGMTREVAESATKDALVEQFGIHREAE